MYLWIENSVCTAVTLHFILSLDSEPRQIRQHSLASYDTTACGEQRVRPACLKQRLHQNDSTRVTISLKLLRLLTHLHLNSFLVGYVIDQGGFGQEVCGGPWWHLGLWWHNQRNTEDSFYLTMFHWCATYQVDEAGSPMNHKDSFVFISLVVGQQVCSTINNCIHKGPRNITRVLMHITLANNWPSFLPAS